MTQKSNIRTWSNSRGEGRLFSVNLLDESGEIRATGFTDVVDKYYELLEVNKASLGMQSQNRYSTFARLLLELLDHFDIAEALR